MINGTLFLMPAYGKTYGTVEQVKQDWEEGADFKVVSGPYCSIRNFKDMKNDWDRIVVIYTGTYDVELYDSFQAI